jgi:predicted MFS family arabinose efflux permease
MATIAEPVPTADFSRGYRSWLLLVLLLVCLVNYADRSVVASVAEPLRRDLGLNDTQLGLLQGLSFALLYSFLGVPFARLAERWSRINILAACTVVWSVMTVLCGAAANFTQMLLARVGVGVGEAGFTGPANSLVGDHFPPNRRAFAISVMMLGVPAGALIGASTGGIIADSLGWRWAFVIMGVPGILVAALVKWTLREPARGASGEAAESDVPGLASVAASLFRRKLFLLVLAGGTLGGFGLHGLGQFLGVYFARVHALSFGQAGVIYGLVTFVSLTIGLLLSGAVADRLGKRDLAWYSWVPAIGLALSVPLYLVAFQAETMRMAIPFLILAGICLLAHFGPAMATLQNLSTPRTRASTVALYSLVVSILATGLAPVIVGAASDLFAQGLIASAGADCPPETIDAACTALRGDGLRMALSCSTVFYALGALCFWLAGRESRKEALNA